MKILLLIFCITGLAYCLLQICAISYEFVHYYRTFKKVCVWFNVQYRILREYIKSDMSAEDIIRAIELEDPENVDVVAFKDHISVLYIEGANIKCTNSTEIRDAFLKVGTFMEMLREYFRLHNIVFEKGIYDENEDFFKELKRVRKSKGESTEFDIKEEIERLEAE